ncbi:hypothetical protein EMIT019CA3_20301 [Bacillus pseudomycoides]
MGISAGTGEDAQQYKRVKKRKMEGRNILCLPFFYNKFVLARK